MTTFTKIQQMLTGAAEHDVSNWGFKLFICLIVFVVGFFLIRFALRGLRMFLLLHKVDRSQIAFLVFLGGYILSVILFLIVAAQIGVPLAVFSAILASAAWTVKMALDNSLQDLISGVKLLTKKSVKIGDTININGMKAIVEDISIFNTRLKLVGYKETVAIPNTFIVQDKIQELRDKINEIVTKKEKKLSVFDIDVIEELTFNNSKNIKEQ